MQDAVFLDDVDIGERHRALDKKRVKMLAESMSAIGLQTPISIWQDGDVPRLVAGLHRFEAAKSLGWEDIDCTYVEMDALDRELWEIDENLCRADLSEIERAQHHKRRKEIFEARRSAEKIPTSRVNKGFDQDTADKTGQDKSTIRKSRARAEKIAEDVQEAVKEVTPDAKGVELDALAGLGHDEQRQAMERVKGGEDIRQAIEFITGETDEDRAQKEREKRREKAWKAWIALDESDRTWLLSRWEGQTNLRVVK